MITSHKFLGIGEGIVPACANCSGNSSCAKQSLIDVHVGELSSLGACVHFGPTDSVDALVVSRSALDDFLSIRHNEKSHSHLSHVPYLVGLERSQMQDPGRLPQSAMDFIALPYCPAELKRRLVENIRSAAVTFEFLPLQYQVKFEGITIQLTKVEMKALKVLHDAGLAGATRAEICKVLWPKTKVCSKTLDVHLSGIRKKINPLGLNIFFRSPGTFTLAAFPTNALIPKPNN